MSTPLASGCTMTKTPAKPTRVANHLLTPAISFKKMIAKIVTNKLFAKLKAVASAIGMCCIAKKLPTIAIMANITLTICSGSDLVRNASGKLRAITGNTVIVMVA